MAFHHLADEDDAYELWMQQELDDFGLGGVGMGVPDYLGDADLMGLHDDGVYYDNMMDAEEFLHMHDGFSDDDFLSDFDDSDDDYDPDEGPDRDHNKIFVSLQDSSVLRRLSFHRTAGRFRQPRVRLGKPETYESLYHVLEELEMLLRTWRKRTQHAYTAHIARGGVKEEAEKGSEDQGGQQSQDDSRDRLEFGVDYQDHDMEHESDSERGSIRHGPPAGGGGIAVNGAAAGPTGVSTGSNEALTKKKYCQSTRLFHRIFDSDRAFEHFLGRVRRMRKHVHDIIFNLFLGCLPRDCAQRLPHELWEKIWKLTQTQYSESGSFHAGLRARGLQDRELESDRVTDLFGAAGNLHMTVFEILYKHSHISGTPPLMEVESLEVWAASKGEIGGAGGEEAERKHSYVKSLFTRYQKNLERHFHRLRDLDIREDSTTESETTVSRKDSSSKKSSSAEDEDFPSSRTSSLLSRGHYTLHREVIPPLKKRALHSSFIVSNEMCLTPQTHGAIVAFLDSTIVEAEESYVGVILWDVARKRRAATVRTGLKFLQSILGLNHNCPQQLFAVTEKRFAFLNRDLDAKEDRFTLYQWEVDKDWDDKKLGLEECKPIIEGLLATPPPKEEGDPSEAVAINMKSRLSLKLTEIGGKEVFLVCHQSPYKCETSVLFFDAATGDKLPERTLSFPGREVTLEACKGTRAMLRDAQSKDFLFYDIGSAPPRLVSAYGCRDVCRDASHDHENPRTLECVYEVKFDSDPDRKQFLIFAQNMTSYQLFEYDDDEDYTEGEEPEVIASGSTLCYELNWRTLRAASLCSGVLVSGAQREVQLRTHSGDYFTDDCDVDEFAVHAFDLYSCQVLPVACLLVNPFAAPVDALERAAAAKGGAAAAPYGALALSDRQFETNHSVALMNDHSRRWFLTNCKGAHTHWADPRTLLVAMPHSYLAVNIHAGEDPAGGTAEADLGQLAPFAELRRREEEERRRKEAEAARKAALKVQREEDKRKRRQRALGKYVDQEVEATGKLVQWNNNSYGFLQPFEQDLRPLGNIFVHISDMTMAPSSRGGAGGRKTVRRFQRFSFNVKSQKDGKFRAANVRQIVQQGSSSSPQKKKKGEKEEEEEKKTEESFAKDLKGDEEEEVKPKEEDGGKNKEEETTSKSHEEKEED